MTLAQAGATVLENGRDVLTALLAYLAMEIRRDVRATRDKVIILWRDHEQKREGVSAPDGAYKSSLEREVL